MNDDVGYKLIRDRIPELVNDDEDFDTFILDGDAYRVALGRKLVEEAMEATCTPWGHQRQCEELADLYEVIQTIAHLTFGMDAVIAAAKDKRKARGGFSRRIALRIPPTVPPELDASEPNC